MKKLYDGIMNAAQLIKNGGNTELYRDLLDLAKDALVMQEEIMCLKSENAEFLKTKMLEEKIERHQVPYITLKGDELQIKYCAKCWDDEGKIIQAVCNVEVGEFKCPKCETLVVYDPERKKEYARREAAARAPRLGSM